MRIEAEVRREEKFLPLGMGSTPMDLNMIMAPAR